MSSPSYNACPPSPVSTGYQSDAESTTELLRGTSLELSLPSPLHSFGQRPSTLLLLRSTALNDEAAEFVKQFKLENGFLDPNMAPFELLVKFPFPFLKKQIFNLSSGAEKKSSQLRHKMFELKPLLEARAHDVAVTRDKVNTSLEKIKTLSEQIEEKAREKAGLEEQKIELMVRAYADEGFLQARKRRATDEDPKTMDLTFAQLGLPPIEEVEDEEEDQDVARLKARSRQLDAEKQNIEQQLQEAQSKKKQRIH
eukprot:CAMPEP_0194026652 /NCGR_PEP_ID=MMETSP0009_2-20130614/963_1 /TAXON_ID=210454 /ORGANISM="Grammatophora oceanica, Strain CCMP 410" /LENGTH=253 /DNA_ID=CAMNT_0038665479 /DNA_START=68 /DNA_END=829 /DNA_ORIENTATION=+